MIRILLGIPTASCYYWRLTFRNAVSVHLLKMEPIQCSETSVFNNYKTPGEYPEEFLSLKILNLNAILLIFSVLEKIES